MNGATVLTKFTADTKDFDKKAQNVSKSLGSLTGSFVKGSLIAGGLSKAMGLVSNNMDKAIDRFDTLNNFPKVMKNLGQSTEDSQKAIDKMAEKLSGLPTTLQDGALAVQRFTSKNGDVKKSADLFLAVNNAILAGGAPTGNQAAALEQLTQAYSRGKFELAEWKSLQIAMPAQLKQVANAMGYVSDSDLYEALKNDDVAMDDFMNTIMKLNSEGTNGLASFEEQARGSTTGIRTALTNLNTRVATGLAEMLKSVNKGLSKAGLGNIAQVADKVGTSIKNALISAAPYVTKFIVVLANLFNFVNKHKTLFTYFGTVLLSFVGTFKVVTKAINIAKTAFMLFNAVLALNPIVLVISAIVALIAGLVLLYKKCDWFRNLVNGIFEWIVNFFRNNWKNILLFLINPFAGAFSYLYNHCTSFRNFVNNFVTTIVNWFKSIPSKLASVARGIVNAYLFIPKQMYNIGKNIMQGLWNGISGLKNYVISKVKGMGKSILNGLKNALGIHSPSTEFALIGKFSVLGFTEQLDKMKSKLQEQVNDTFGISPQLATTSSLHYSPNVIVNNTINQTQDPLGRMVNQVKTYSGGARNDYNYGQGVA
jgi:tape measure domain-containing protein